MLHRLVMVTIIAIPMSPFFASAQTPARDGNESNFKDWQPTRGEVSAEERAAGVRQTPAERRSEDRELQDLSEKLLRQEQPSSSVQPANSR